MSAALLADEKRAFYRRPDVAAAYDGQRFGGRSGAYVNERECRAVLELLPAGGTLVDVACGTGDPPRARTGCPVLTRAETDLVALASAAVDAARLLTATHALRLEAPAEPVVGRWDSRRLGQVLANLIGNAVKHTDGGEVVVRVEALEAADRVSVRDQGPGIPLEVLPHLFERFYRAVPANDAPRGHGLGLYLCRSLVEAHGGRIWAESTPGVGSTFSFELPRPRGAAKSEQRPAPTGAGRTLEDSKWSRATTR